MRLEMTAKICSDDSEDTYDYVLEDSAEKVVVSWKLRKAKDSGALTLTNKTRDAASLVFWMDQGTVFSVDKDRTFSTHKNTGKLAALPAFLLGRKAYAQLVAGKSVYIHALWGTGADSVKVTTGTVTITVAGKKQPVPVLLIDADDVRLAVLRSWEWPLVLSRKEAGDNSLELATLSELPPLDDQPLPEAVTKKPAAKSKQPVSEVEALVVRMGNDDDRRKATRELNELRAKRDISDEIVEVLERGQYLTLPPSDSPSKKLVQRTRLISLLSERPGKRGEALLRQLAQPGTESRLRSHAAAALLNAMKEQRLPRDEVWILAQADAIDGTDRQLWPSAVEAGALLGAKYFYERFAPFLDAKRMTDEDGLERVNEILNKYDDGDGQDRRWKQTLKPLCKHEEFGPQIERALGL